MNFVFQTLLLVLGGAQSDGSTEESDGEEDKTLQISSPGAVGSCSQNVGQLLAQAKQQQTSNAALLAASKLLICCACLGDRSDAINEIVECDGCGVTVHEGNILII